MPTCATCGAENPEEARFCNACGASLEVAGSTSRRRVSVLFCDLVGSTALSERIDAEALHAVMSRYWQAVRAVAERHEGRVEKFIGDAIMGVFGVPRLHEDDALRAVLAADEMRRAVEGLNDELTARWGVSIRVRAGVATGEVVVSSMPGGPAVVGSALNLAARLETEAVPGEVLLDAETRRLVRERVDAEPVDPRTLAGFAEPVEVFRLLEVRPSGVAGDGDPAFVGRETELALLRQLREDTQRSGRCRIVTVLGDAGIGKSRLIREFVARESGGGAALIGRCRAYGGGSALRPIGDAVANDADEPGWEDLSVRLRSLLADRAYADAIADAFLGAVGFAPHAVPEDEAFSAVRAVLGTLARRRPLLLALDDVQWAGPALLDCVQHLAEWSRDAPIVVICLARPDLTEVMPWWGRTPGEVTIRLDPLTRDEGRSLVRSLGGAPPHLEAQMIEVAGGNPFFLREIATELREHPAADRPSVQVPPTISALLAARIDRLPPEELEVLERAAVIGGPFMAPSLTALEPGSSTEGAEPVLRALVSKEFLVAADRPGNLRFRHDLTREAAYRSIPKQRRAELHERAARAVLAEGESRSAGVAGTHLERARDSLLDLGPGAASAAAALGAEAAGLLAIAGREAAARDDVRSAAASLERAAALLPPGDADRLGILADLHDAVLASGDPDRAGVVVGTLLAELGPDAPGPLAARARMQQALVRSLVDPNAIPREALRATLDDAIAVFERDGDVRDLAAAYGTRAMASWVEGNAAGMQADAERGLELARSSGNRTAMIAAASTLAAALIRGPVPFAEVEPRLAALIEELRDFRLAQATLRLDLASVLAQEGELDRADAETELARATMEELGHRRWLARASDTAAELARLRRDHVRAAELRRSVYAAFLQQGDEVNAHLTALDLAADVLAVGNLEEADALAAEVERTAPADDLELQVGWRGVRAEIAARRGEGERALRLAREAVTRSAGTDFLLARAAAAAALADVYAALGHEEADRARADAIALFDRKGATAEVALLRE